MSTHNSGSSFKCLEEAFEIYKNSPIDVDSFELVCGIVDNFLVNSKLENTLDLSEESVGSYCGISFKKDQLMYHCSDCALDETCVLCDKCFNFDVHKHHNFWYTIGSDNSGSCDCGEDDSWKNDLKCPHHQCKTNEGVVDQNLKESISKLKQVLRPILEEVIHTLKEYSAEKKMESTEKSILILYNDENHSFDDVIDTLCTEIEITLEDAEAYAKLVDIKGFAPIVCSSSATCARISRKFKTLSTSVESIELAFKMIAATEIMSFLSERIASSLPLRKFFVDWFLECTILPETEEIGAIERVNNLGLLMEMDHLLWKRVRLGFNDILNSCNAIDQESKKQIALTYCKQFEKIYDSFSKEKRESHLSITNFSVQIFTLIPVAEYCLEHSNILSILFGKMVEILEPGFVPAAGMEFAKLRNFNFQKFSVLTHDALHLTRNIRSDRLNIPNLSRTVAAFMYLLSLLTHQQGHFIKTGDHVTYDRRNYDNANILCYELQQIGQELAKVVVNNCEMGGIWNLFEKYIDQRPSLYKLVSTNAGSTNSENSDDQHPMVPLFKSRRRWSFFGSLGWFYAAVVKEAVKRFGASKLSIPSKIVKCFAIDSLHRLLFSAEVRSGLWVRNGLIVVQQEHLYSATCQHNLTYYPDVYNCIIGGHLIDRVPFIEMIMKHSCIMEYLQIQEQTGPVVDQLMILFMNCCSSRIPDLNSDQILINTLSTGSLPKKILIRMLPEWFIEEASFREKVLAIAKLTSVNSIGADAKLEITKHQLDNFDPFYWAFPMNFRLKAWSHFKEKRRSHLEHFSEFFMKNYPISAEITKELDFLIEMLLNFADSTSTDYEFCLEMVLIVLKAVTSITSDSEVLDRVSDCIKKFRLKRNINESVLLFLESICPATQTKSQDVDMVDNESSLESKTKRKSSILASFKRQRNVFIGEPQATFEDDEHTCVVCSESGSGEDEENFLGFPLQICEASLMSVSNKKCSFMRGCYHLVHKKCFDSLPVAANECKFKMCTLCNSAIDKVIPLIIKPIIQVPTVLNLVDCTDVILEGEEASNAFDLLLNVFCCTVIYMCESVDSVESIPLHQILTLTQMKRHLMEKLNQKSIVSETKCDPVSIMEMLVSQFIYHARGEVSIEKFSLIYGIVLKSTLPIEIVNFALNLLMFESICKAQVVVNGDDSNSKTISGVDFKMNLIELPDRHDLFLKRFLTEKCKDCGTVPKSAAVCLLCGTLVCVGQLCCRTDVNNGECFAHREACSGSAGIFLIIKSCALLIISENIGAVVPAPYVNVFGEHDFDLSSASALFLNRQLYHGKLTEMWKNYELRDFILRNMDNSRITAHSWAML